jgi:hypothetical protein
MALPTCPHCGRPVTTGPGPVVTRRWSGKYEAAGCAFILTGLGLFFWMPRLGALHQAGRQGLPRDQLPARLWGWLSVSQCRRGHGAVWTYPEIDRGEYNRRQVSLTRALKSLEQGLRGQGGWRILVPDGWWPPIAKCPARGRTAI